MTSRVFVGAVGAACIGAAVVGAYLAVQPTVPGSEAPTTVTQGPVPPPTSPGSSSLESRTTASVTRRPTASAPKPALPDQSAKARSSVQPESGPLSAPAAQPTADRDGGQSNPEATAARTEPDLLPPVETTLADLVGPEPATVKTTYDEVEVPADAVVGIRLETAVSSETSRVEDRITGLVTRDVKIEGRTVIPAGTQIAGHVSIVERGGKVRERARVGIRFTSLSLDDTRIPIETETIFRDGESPGGEATAKIGASAVIGTILGGAFGGKKGAAIGGAAGAAGGTAVVMAGERNPAMIAAGTPLTVRLSLPVTLRVPQ